MVRAAMTELSLLLRVIPVHALTGIWEANPRLAMKIADNFVFIVLLFTDLLRIKR